MAPLRFRERGRANCLQLHSGRILDLLLGLLHMVRQTSRFCLGVGLAVSGGSRTGGPSFGGGRTCRCIWEEIGQRRDDIRVITRFWRFGGKERRSQKGRSLIIT